MRRFESFQSFCYFCDTLHKKTLYVLTHDMSFSFYYVLRSRAIELIQRDILYVRYIVWEKAKGYKTYVHSMYI